MYNMQYNYGGTEASYKSLEDALNLVKQAVQGERQDELFYDYLISVAPTQEEVDIITSIRNDERKHNKMFREIYEFFTGQELPQSNDTEFNMPSSYIEGIKKALFGELSAVERYRNIRAGIPTRYYRDMVFEILTDELKHADKYNYILNINPKEDEVSSMQNSTTQQKQNNKANDESQYSPDKLVEYINPLVKLALEEVKEGINLEHLFQEYILAGVLVGSGFTTKQAIDEVENWEKTGASKLLQESKMKK